MSRGRGTASIVASPVLVGAVTTLIVIVAVFLAYNANKGLPFVPTYDLSAQLPSASNLVPGNEVRVGGFRVGVIDRIRPGLGDVNGTRKEIAIVDMKLDKTMEPLSRDSHLIVRARSALGLKYIQLTPGRSKASFKAGDTIPLSRAGLPVEFDDLLNTFDEQTRSYSRGALVGFGDAFAGRGADLNVAIGAFNPFFTFLTPVMRNLSDPRTRLNEFFKQIGETTSQVAPVARVQARLFTEMANTFAAINACPRCLQATIEKGPGTEDVAIRSLRVQRPFLVDFIELSRLLRPAVRELPRALPPLSDALRVGTPVVRSSVTLNNETTNVFHALNDLVTDPNTGLALHNARDTLAVLKPLVNFVAPYQTVCNDATYFFTELGGHISQLTTGGTAERVSLRADGTTQQDNKLGSLGDRPADVPANMNVHTAKDPASGQNLEVLHGQPYPPAIDAHGNADCQAGQIGYPNGPYIAPYHGRYPPANVANPNDPNQLQQFFRFKSGGSHVVNSNDNPLLSGPTFTGLRNVRQVP